MSNEMKGPVLEPEYEEIYWVSYNNGEVRQEPYVGAKRDQLLVESLRMFYTEEEARDRIGYEDNYRMIDTGAQTGRWVPFAEAVKPEEVEEWTMYFAAHKNGGVTIVEVQDPEEFMDLRLAKEGRLFPFSPSGFLAAERKSEELKKLNQTNP